MLLTPPLTLTPGSAALIWRVASMNATAYWLCSSMPVATVRMAGSKMMSVGRHAGLLGEQAIGARGDGQLALGGVGLALFVEGHDDDAGAVAADFPGLLQEDVSRLP